MKRVLAFALIWAMQAAFAQNPVSGPVEGEVRRVDKDGQKITIRHGPIPALDMQQGMTMVFRVKDRSLLERVKPGDRVRFEAENAAGVFTVTRIEPAR